ncbi:MAG: extracellular solute-binding protein [Brachybacterium sp.]|uniref:extracellular solute-binding protein n=1 Tax=Brachybacterium sp. TaxID=1891286 RepID=UPI0026488D95|nr:extracellular solute-binding protein [Brachybacterium sp.]MDN5685911.1 extracellular solute-binding protein [Brachybacterium sp.]
MVPEFTKAQKEKGRDITLTFEPQGVDDEDYKTKIALDLKSGKGADVLSIDGIWVGEFAQAGYIKPLSDVAKDSDSWEGWDQISEAVQGSASFDGDRYGVSQGTDGRVIYFHKGLFEQAGLPGQWQPTSWDEIVKAGQKLSGIDGVTPIQLNAGSAMGEATTMQGFLPMLVGTGTELWADEKWQGDTSPVQDVLNLYKHIYIDEKLGDPILQQEASGRDSSFSLFAEGKIGILLEGDYFWRSVINPAEGVGTAPMKDRDEVVGYTKIPAMEPGAGIRDQDFVSMSGGGCNVINPNAPDPDLAWELIAFMSSPEAFAAKAKGTLNVTPRDDVNKELLKDDPMLSWLTEEVLPLTAYRPSLAPYPEVSVAIQQATLDVVSGTEVDAAATKYGQSVVDIVGEDAVTTQ